MGEVWVAKQSQPVRRRLALKLIRRGMDSQQLVRRFEAERQELVANEHPNVAKVLDAGTSATGHPNFVMELWSTVSERTFERMPFPSAFSVPAQAAAYYVSYGTRSDLTFYGHTSGVKSVNFS